MKKVNFTLHQWCTKLLFALFALTINYFNSTAQLTITVSGQVSGTNIQQGAVFQWQISGLIAAAQVTNQLWIDKNENNIIEPSTDILFVEFTQTDGVPGGESPGDDDATANGIINTNLPGYYFAPAKYIFKTSYGSNVAQALFTVTVLQNITYTIGGRVTQNENGLANITIQVRRLSGTGEYFGITNSSGYYIINTDIPAGTSIEIQVAQQPFNLGVMNGLYVSPNKITNTLNSNITLANFTVSNTPLALSFQNINVIAQQQKVKINWTVLDEAAIDNYFIERSADGISFTTIGNQQQLNRGEYNFIDETAIKGWNFYRIKSVAKDGSIMVSRTVSVEIEIKGKDVIIYPNPTNAAAITVTLLQPAIADSYRIFSMEGKMMQQGYISNTTQNINISTLQAGAYLIKIGYRQPVIFIKQ